ncbi:tigger transposable element-derived protein 4 [Nephila pilipes]|uniref:Tigger transposable element-derived protein 4 n=1 Tax=Nephila pilipes TaxID=299642 RepID=A0A8X6PF39_NEPPI|nr:tigger transposable element-derived protein 4 [Nephila pilipes]
MVFIGCLIRRERYNSGRFIQEVQTLTPLSSSLETYLIYPYTLNGNASFPCVIEVVSRSFIALISLTLDKGVKKNDIALKCDIPPNSLSTIITNRDKLRNYDSSNSCSKRLRTCVYEDADEAVLKWIYTMRDKNVPIYGPFVIEKALQFAKALGYDQFLGSNG